MTLASVPSNADRRLSRRADRYDARRVLWSQSALPRVRACGKHLCEGAAGVGVRVSGSLVDGTRSAGFAGLQSCGSVWACTVCSAKVAAHRQQELTAAMLEHEARGGGFVVATFTMRHHRGQSLRGLWDALASAWTRSTSGGGWQALQDVYGFPMPRVVCTGRRAGQTVVETRVPTVRVVEVTNGPSGWHVHVHAILFVAGAITDATADVIGADMFGRWSAALVAAGLEAPSEAHGFEAHAAHGGSAAASALGDYFTKSVYEGTALAALEVTRGDLKDGRGPNRTPFQILRGIAGHAEYQEGDLEAWAEWERASKGRRQIAWSPGLREHLAVAAELTDEEVADLEHGGATLLVIDRGDWYRAVALVRGRQALYLALAEADDTGEALRGALQGHGIAFWEPERAGAPGDAP